MKTRRLLPFALALLSLGLAGCGNGGDQPAPASSEPAASSQVQPSASQQSEAPQSVIKSLEATAEQVELKLGEATSVTPYYKLTGYKNLTSKEKKVTVTSSDTEVVKIVGNIMTGLKANGTATITVKSQADETKTCSFQVLVKDIYFNRTYSEINAADDLSKELPEDGGIVQTTGGTSDMLIYNQKASKRFMASVKLAVNSVSEGELWPKFGMVFKQVDESEDLTMNYLIFFLDGPINRVKDGAASWTDFGYCEIANGVFGWDTVPAQARHKEDAFIKKTAIDYNEFFTLTSVVEGRKIHMFLGYGEGEEAKEVYMCTVEGYADLYGEGNGNGFIPGFFQFNSVVTYKDYTYVTDEAEIAAKMDGVTERLATYDHGDTEGTTYYEE